ncbi:hypothetical protein EVAR_74161_1, partial [Eumeta japonica]
MDELDEQLRHLSIINSRLSFSGTSKDSSADGNHSNVAKLVNNIEEKNNFSQEYQSALKNRLIFRHDLNSSKKVGPSVPPKPHKKSPNVPEIKYEKNALAPYGRQAAQKALSETLLRKKRS